MINNSVEKIQSERVLIYNPKEGASYSHHASLAFFKGRLFAMWSNGQKNEDDCGQCVMISDSEDFYHWSEPRVLISPKQTDNPFDVYTAAGFHTYGNKLHAYYGHYGYDPDSMTEEGVRPMQDAHHLNTGLSVISSDDGLHWGKPQDLNLPMIPNHGPQATHTGRLIISGNTLFPYSDDPSGIGVFKQTGIYGNVFGDKPFCDDSESIQFVTKANGWTAKLICEGSFFETDDHVLHMMLRSNSKTLWCSDSKDNGETWSQPYPTNFSDDGSKFHFGRLPDGRFYCVSNPIYGSGRNPLTISISNDGENFRQQYILRDEAYDMQFEGMYKGGLYGYPHTILDNNNMYIIYSKRKEAIEITKVALSSLI